MSAQEYRSIDLNQLRSHLVNVAQSLTEQDSLQRNDVEVLIGYIYVSEDDSNWEDIQSALVYGGTSLDVDILKEINDHSQHLELEKLIALF